MRSHVFIDNSNIFFGARKTALRLEPGACPHALRLFYPQLFRLEYAEADHVRPWSLGGRTELENGRAVHKHCHRRGRLSRGER